MDRITPKIDVLEVSKLKVEDLRDVNEEKVEYGDVLKIKDRYFLVVRDTLHRNIRLVDLSDSRTSYTYDNLNHVMQVREYTQVIKSDRLKLVIE